MGSPPASCDPDSIDRPISRREARRGGRSNGVSLFRGPGATFFRAVRRAGINRSDRPNRSDSPDPSGQRETKPPPHGRITGTMHQLLLLRHAKSSWDSAGVPDRDRPLNARGRRAAAAMRRAMREFGLIPDLILVPSAKRTMETMSALEPGDDTPLIEPMDDLYLASEASLLATLRGVAETVRTVLLIGHNPGMHELAVTLADPRGSPERLL